MNRTEWHGRATFLFSGMNVPMETLRRIDPVENELQSYGLLHGLESPDRGNPSPIEFSKNCGLTPIPRRPLAFAIRPMADG